MKLSESQMSENAYNKTDAETWMTAPKFEQTKKSSFLDVSSLVLYDETFLDGMETEENKLIDINNLYGNGKRTN